MASRLVRDLMVLARSREDFRAALAREVRAGAKGTVSLFVRPSRVSATLRTLHGQVPVKDAKRLADVQTREFGEAVRDAKKALEEAGVRVKVDDLSADRVVIGGSPHGAYLESYVVIDADAGSMRAAGMESIVTLVDQALRARGYKVK